MKYKILIVDDESANLRMLERLLTKEFEVLTATSGHEGLDILGAHDVALILSDQRMPVMTGMEFLNEASKLRPHTVRIILTGYTDVATLVEAINSGVVYKYITKPWSNADLMLTLQRGVEHFETSKSQHLLVEENRRLRERMDSSIRGFGELLIEMLGLRSPKISAHARRTADYACQFGTAAGLDDKELEQLFLAALLHEVAHLRMPEHLLLRTTMLREGELRVMQDRFREGVEMLGQIPELAGIAETISFQHTHFDGLNSFGNLSGDQIPVNSRLLAIVDSYDEMRQPGMGTRGFGHADALLVLKGAAGRKFDPALVDLFCGLEVEDGQTLQPERPALALAV
jgi:response regulator RpfG family c-di-GMP phosphodiesterase